MNKNNSAPDNDSKSLEASSKNSVPDIKPEEDFNCLATLAAYICKTPIAMIALVNSKKKWINSKVEFSSFENRWDRTFCNYTIAHDELFEVTDSLNDERFRNNPLVTGEPKVRFYAGLPLKDVNGEIVGTICVIDVIPKKLTQEQIDALKTLGEQIVTQLELKELTFSLHEETKKTAQNEIDSLEDNLKAYKEALDETAIVAITDQKGIIVYANQKFCDISKYSREELIGQDHRIVNSGYHSQEFIKNLWATISNGKVWRGEMRNKAKDGSFYWLDATIVPFLNKDGTPIKYFAIRQDITRKKEIEMELLIAKEKAEQSVIAKNNFLANMSHEIRTPMNAIIGFTDLLAQSPLDEKQKEYVNSVKLAGTDLLSIINDILDFSKIESGKITIESVPFSLKEQIKNIHNLLKAKAKDKNLEYNFSLDDSLPDYVIGDSLRLNQILINLIGNAIKFTKEGGITVSIKNVEENGLNYKLKFIIQDTGIGIPADKLDIIFDRFSQASNETTRKYGGTGLGLSIAKNLIELQGGDLKVKSESGKGSEFSFEIIFKKVDKSAIEPIEKILAPMKSVGHIKILVFEDNRLNQRLAENVLGNLGFEVEIAENGKIGIEKLKKAKFDLILMDIQMPEMDGYQATSAIRKELNLQIPIIAMTAHSLVGEKEKCITIGMNDYITKPFKQDDLYYKINSVVNSVKDNSNRQKKLRDEKIANLKTDNLSYLKELSGGNKEFEREMIELFLKQVPQDINTLDQAFKEADAFRIKSLSHKLKSSMPIAGLSVLEPHLSAIEKNALNKEMIGPLMEKFSFVKNTLNEHYSFLQKKLMEEYL